MRTFPKALSTFRKIVDERGEQLRKLSFVQIKAQASAPIEQITVNSRRATIATIVIPQSDGIQVVLQGFMEHKLMPGKSVALHGFYKYPTSQSRK